MVGFSLVRKLLPFTFMGSMIGTLAVVSFTTLICKAYYYRPTRLCHTFVVFKRIGAK